MERITCSTTLSNYRWPEAWHVKDGENTAFKHKLQEKLLWIEAHGVKTRVIETMGGWAFRDKQTASLFVLTWS